MNAGELKEERKELFEKLLELMELRKHGTKELRNYGSED